MKILHILSEGPKILSDQIIAVQSEEHEVKVIDLTKKAVSYEKIIDAIFLFDRVISW
ncbi:MAG: hypothetical protein HY755_03010 [Nitrospirae bacterium]|nr:hypothetical protein [Nitrospirota bacterium]